MKPRFLILIASIILGACEKDGYNVNNLPQPDYKYINQLHLSDDVLWVLSSAPSSFTTFAPIIPPYQISKINLKTNEIVSSGKLPNICEMVFDNGNKPFLGTYDRKVIKINSDLSFEQYLEIPKISLIREMIFNLKNNLWVATYGGGLFYYNGTDTSRYNTSNSILASNGIASMTKDSESNIWFIQGQELFKIDRNNNISKDPNLFPINNNTGAFNLTADKDNSLWVSRWDGNYHKIFKKPRNSSWIEINPPVSSNDRPIKFIRSINGTIWISYSDYPKDLLAYFDSNKWIEVQVPLDEINITDVVSYHNDLFIGTPQGIYTLTLK